jgi:hypothetical protein
MTESSAVAFLRGAPMGTRVVVRHHLSDPSGPSATDVLGYLSAIDDTHCVVASARGLVTIELAAVIAAKEIPPPPVRG